MAGTKNPSKKSLVSVPVKDIKLKKNISVKELFKEMEHIGGFSAQHMVIGTHIVENMFADKDSFNFLSFPADIVSTGLRGVLASMTKHFDAIITTGGTVDHDLARAFGGVYSLGTFNADDAYLHSQKVYRLGNVFIENDEYGLKVENSFKKIMDDIYTSKDYKKEYSASELLYEFGKRIKDEGSILRQAYLHNVKIFNPGIL
ncbi:deoxyhypusine synthase family protein, partial [Candidatus Marsarchaeota archaeon]|nr:deoxyhypusine synthase family protein [Candidatus Marsarchaeota archaeon]